MVKQELVLVAPGVESQHPYSQKVQGSQELARMEEGGKYKEENYNNGGYGDEEDQAMAETGIKQNKELTGYMMSEGLAHTCSLCARSFSEAKSCKRHIREMHLGLGRRVCPHCNKKVSRIYRKRHMATCKLAKSY